MFQASPPRHEAKLRSVFALPHFNKLTVLCRNSRVNLWSTKYRDTEYPQQY
jgi:hypothetical protein